LGCNRFTRASIAARYAAGGLEAKLAPLRSITLHATQRCERRLAIAAATVEGRVDNVPNSADILRDRYQRIKPRESSKRRADADHRVRNRSSQQSTESYWYRQDNPRSAVRINVSKGKIAGRTWAIERQWAKFSASTIGGFIRFRDRRT